MLSFGGKVDVFHLTRTRSSVIFSWLIPTCTQEAFAEYDPKEVIVMENRFGKRLGFGFVTLGSPELAEKALALNKTKLFGRLVSISIAYEKSKAE